MNDMLENDKTEVSVFHKDKKEYVIILEQCSQNVKSWLENDEEFGPLENDDDVVGLLAKIK